MHYQIVSKLQVQMGIWILISLAAHPMIMQEVLRVLNAAVGQEKSGSWQQSLASCIAARMGRLSVGVGHRYPVTMHKVSLKALSIRQVYTLQHQNGAQYSVVG